MKAKRMVVVGPHSLELEFNNRVTKRVNLLPLIWIEMFAPLRGPAYFRGAMLDPRSSVVLWPNEADVAPEALFALPKELADVIPTTITS